MNQPLLTKSLIRITMIEMTDKAKIIRGALAAAVFGLFLGPQAMRPGPQTTAQEPPPREVQKPSYNYMDSFLSRSTNPLGLKEDPAARRMLGQGPVAWAIRAGSRHVLD
jgi:hypothetical protein